MADSGGGGGGRAEAGAVPMVLLFRVTPIGTGSGYCVATVAGGPLRRNRRRLHAHPNSFVVGRSVHGMPGIDDSICTYGTSYSIYNGSLGNSVQIKKRKRCMYRARHGLSK